jgi:hypothetical protein
MGHTADTPSEYQVKAAYLYNFAKFIKWPGNAFADTAAPLVIGVLGRNDFAGELTKLSSKSVRNRSIEIKQFETVKEIQTCHLLYINTSKSIELASILSELRTRPIITVGDTDKFALHGGVIQFVTVRGRLRFIINLDTAKMNHVQIDAQLLSLAIEVLGAYK